MFSLFVLKVGFIGVLTSQIRRYISFSSYFSFFGGSEICPQTFSFRNRINQPSPARSSQQESESLTLLSAILKSVSCDTVDPMTKLALVIGLVLEPTHSHGSINQLNLADFSSES